MQDRLFIMLQYILPQHLLSRLAGGLANCTQPWVKNTFITWFVKRYQVDMSQAVEPDPMTHACFNDFFTRALKPDARPLDPDPKVVLSPADGVISQLGSIEHGRIFQAKGHSYSVLELVGGDPRLASLFQGGQFATVYLSPRDYHRVHMPYGGTLRQMIYVPGQLFSVNRVTAENVPRLFSRNERVVCLFDTPAGPMGLVLVGAMIVASVETVWAGLVAPHRRQLQQKDYSEAAPQLDRGAEMGRFKLGSTAIVLFGPGKVGWDSGLSAGDFVRMGQKMGVHLE
ncbi:MAG TPA: phosphatidylserine decarboxylase [Pseudomonas xinjiangensis]|uniref:Phosphatidylserine decarboxylase proenzyme n=2 Tax=root TaxID=1 RepID=A0A7V1FSY3_9GAMM|nr:phosphatidylserine decarboxylase [Halopseudomonas xinjiangensis]HEC49471.1 phosphatidylserine decarboxylase [Halopseudomonas xinjiangensis]